MFVTVKFGEQEEGIFNPQCKCVTLLTTIKDKCCRDDVEVDLSDENGNVKNLRDSPNRYADELLVDRETLVLLKVDRSDVGECRYVPLLNDQGFVTDTFLAQLASGSDTNQGRGKSRNSGRRNNKQKVESKETVSNKNGKSGSSNTQTKSKSRMK